MKKIVEEMDSLLRNITHLMHRTTRKFLEEQGLSIPRFWVLLNVENNPGITMGELQNKLYLAPSSVSSLVDSLVENGLLKRNKDKADRRIIRLTITSQGKTVTQKTLKFRCSKLEEVLEEKDYNDFILVNKVLKHLVDSLQE